MRMSRHDAAKNRERVLRTASEMFRKDGYDGTGIAALMKASGMTNGAFYKQFDSKEALIAEATAQALTENAAAWTKVLAKAEGDPLAVIAQWYLSDPHLEHRDRGCTYATLAAEAPRHEGAVRKAFDDGLRRTLEIISGLEETGDAQRDETAALRYLSRLVGALILARAVEDPDLSRRILEANRVSD